MSLQPGPARASPGILLHDYFAIRSGGERLAAAFLLPPKYLYRATIEIGTVPVNGKLQLIEDPNRVVAEVNVREEAGGGG